MGTFILKRKSYSLSPGRNEINGENAGDAVGRSAGSAIGGVAGAGVGLAGGATLGAGYGAIKGVKEVNNARANLSKVTSSAQHARNAAHEATAAGLKEAKGLRNTAANMTYQARKTSVLANSSKAGNAMKKAGKFGLIAGGIGAGLGALAGKSTGQSVGGAVGTATVGAVGSAVDSVTNNQRTYSVSRITKSIYGMAKKVTPKSKHGNLARMAVKSDRSVKNAAFNLATNPGSIASKAVQKVAENPVTMMPGGLSVGGTVATSINKGKPSTIDSVLKNTIVGKPIYSALKYTGKEAGRVVEPAVNTLANIAKGL